MKRLPWLQIFGRGAKGRVTGVPLVSDIPMPPAQSPKDNGDTITRNPSWHKYKMGESPTQVIDMSDIKAELAKLPRPITDKLNFPGWRVDAPEYHPYEKDGNCMGGPVDAYYRIWAHRESDGKCTCGCGATLEEAADALVINVNRMNAEVAIAAREFCRILGYDYDSDFQLWHAQVREAMAMRQALDKIGRFCPDR